MSGLVPRKPGSGKEIVSLNIGDLDVEELERRLEMVVAADLGGTCDTHSCSCPSLATCGTYCHG